MNNQQTTGPMLENVTDRLVIININKTYVYAKTNYAATKGDWSLNKRRADKADYILSEYKGQIIEVYEFNNPSVGWMPVKNPNPKWVRRRYYFNGHTVKNPIVRSRYIGKIIHKKKGDSYPIHYRNL